MEQIIWESVQGSQENSRVDESNFMNHVCLPQVSEMPVQDGCLGHSFSVFGCPDHLLNPQPSQISLELSSAI